MAAPICTHEGILYFLLFRNIQIDNTVANRGEMRNNIKDIIFWKQISGLQQRRNSIMIIS